MCEVVYTHTCCPVLYIPVLSPTEGLHVVVRDFLFSVIAGGTHPESVCYSEPNCMGNIVAEGLTPRECCAGTDEGQSYSSGGVVCDVPQCIGMYMSAFCVND